MKRVLRSAENFDRKLGNLFETLAGREDELQARVNQIVQGLFDRTITSAPQHNPSDGTCCLPLIDRFVIVFRPDTFTEREPGKPEPGIMLDFSQASRFDLLDIENEELQ